jgi:simple sugar transport system permease protein
MSLDIFLIIGASITYAAALMYPSLGENLTEVAGTYNIGTEGIMLISAATTYVGAVFTGSALIGLLLGIATGALIGAVLAAFSLGLKADQVIFGLGLILMGSFLGIFIAGTVEKTVGTVQVPLFPRASFDSLGYPFNLVFSQNLLVYIAIILAVAMWLLLSKTKFGLAVRAVGENPNVAASAGTNVVLVRTVCAVLGSAIAAVGGSFVLIGVSGIWSENLTAGRGFVGIAIVRIGFFKPLLILVFSLVFGFVDSMQLSLQTVLSGFPVQFLQMLHYITGIVALAISGKYKLAGQPASIGKPYSREER